MRIEGFSRQGSTHNEDIYGIEANYGFVLDGATGLLKEKITEMESDAQWFVHEWKKFLHKDLQNNEKELKEILKEGVKEVDAKYMALNGAENVKSKPSAGIALYRIVENKLEYFLLGDCSLIITKNNDEVVFLQPQELTKFDQINIDRMVKAANEKGVDVIDARAMITNHLLETRLTQNTPQGYYILSDSLEAIDNAMHGTINFEDVKQVVATSDGYSQIFDTFNVYSIEGFAGLVEASLSLSETYNLLWNLQEKDKGCNKYPRFKTRDDATIIVFGV